MELLFVATDNGLSVFNPSNKQEILKFNVPCTAFAVIRDELIVSLVDKPLLHSYKLHRTQQAPRKIVMPGKVVSLCPAGVGQFLFGGIGGSLYSWHAGSGRCIQSVHIHYKDVSIIRANQDFVITGADDGQIGILWTRSLLDIHESVSPLTVISAHQQPITDIFIASDLAFSSSLDFTVKVWNLEGLKQITSKKRKIVKSELIRAVIEYPAAISSINTDGLMLRLFACSMDGRYITKHVSRSQIKIYRELTRLLS